MATLGALKDEGELYDLEKRGELRGAGQHAVRLFKSDKRWRPPIIDPGYAGGKSVSSSVKRLGDDVKQNRDDVQEFGNEIRQLRRFGMASGLAVLIAIAGLLLVLAQLDRSYTDARVSSVINQSTAARIAAAELKKTDAQVAALQAQVRSLLATLRHKGLLRH
jgi:hypothetical protein